MILAVSHMTSDAMRDTVAELMDGGSVELLSAGQHLLATLKLSSPAAGPAVDGVLELNEIHEEPSAPAEGVAAFARVLTRSGDEVFSCDVGTFKSNAVIKLGTTQITLGAPVRLNSFKLAMP